jgi:hypothetical protein
LPGLVEQDLDCARDLGFGGGIFPTAVQHLAGVVPCQLAEGRRRRSHLSMQF